MVECVLHAHFADEAPSADATVVFVVDLTMLPHRDRVVLVTPLDGRQLEGALLVRTDYFEIAGTRFYESEVEEFEDVT